MSPRRFSVLLLTATALPLTSGALAQTMTVEAPVEIADSRDGPYTASERPSPLSCRMSAIPYNSGKRASMERDASGAIWLAYTEVRKPGALEEKQRFSYRTDVPLDFYLDGKKAKPPKGSFWRYTGKPEFTGISIKFAPDAKWTKALDNATTLSIRYKKVEVAAIPLDGYVYQFPASLECAEVSGTASQMDRIDRVYGPNRAKPILRTQSPGLCQFTATDTKAVKALRIGGGPRERKNMTLQLVGPFNGPIDANGHYWLPEDGGMQLLVDGKAYALPDDALKGQSEGANFGQVTVTFSDSDPLFAKLKKAKTVAIRRGKTEVYRYTLPKKHTLFAESAACFQPERDAVIAANTIPNKRMRAKGNPGNWVPQSAYPRGPLRDGIQGTVAFTLSVDKYGYPDECLVSSTSGSPELDNAACASLMRRARFDPATDAKGQLQRDTYSNRVRWVIPQ